METQPAFQIGKAPKLTKEQVRKRKREKILEKQRKEKAKTKKIFEPAPKKAQWRILPCAVDECLLIDTLAGESFFTKMKSLQEFGNFWKETKSELFPTYKPDVNMIESIENLKMRTKKIIVENQIVRWKFKRFLTKWRYQRFRVLNDTDFITLNPIVSSIKLSNYSLRTITLFEASSLLSHIHRQLLHHDGCIPEPLFPKNPYTNTLFTLGQLISIRRQCKEKGESVWTLEAFAKAHYELDKYLQYNRKHLRMHAVKSILYSYKDYDGIDLLLNFIESQHEEHNAQFQKQIYRWCLSNIPEEVRIQKWRNLCKEYYEREILAEDDQGRDNAFYIIRVKTEGLCSPPHELFAKRTLFLQLKKNGSSFV